jgi:hypothetical protein
MNAALSLDRTTTQSQKLVIPVRYIARGEVLQTTSTALSADAIHVRSQRPPALGLFVGLQLYFPDSGEPLARSGVVSWVTAGANTGFWAQFSDDDSKDRLAVLLARQRDTGDRGCPRFHTSLEATLREGGRRVSPGQITNISRSGAFMKLETLPPLGSVVDLDLTLPGHSIPDAVHAYVVHLAPRRGIGLQFIGASDTFRAHLDEYLAILAR